MTEAPDTTQIDATFDTVRPMRHKVIKLCMTAAANMRGEVGISREHQLEHIDAAIGLVDEAVVALKELREEAATRDFDAYLEAKRRKEAATVENDSDEDLSEPDDDDDDDQPVQVFFTN